MKSNNSSSSNNNKSSRGHSSKGLPSKKSYSPENDSRSYLQVLINDSSEEPKVKGESGVQGALDRVERKMRQQEKVAPTFSSSQRPSTPSQKGSQPHNTQPPSASSTSGRKVPLRVLVKVSLGCTMSEADKWLFFVKELYLLARHQKSLPEIRDALARVLPGLKDVLPKFSEHHFRFLHTMVLKVKQGQLLDDLEDYKEKFQAILGLGKVEEKKKEKKRKREKKRLRFLSSDEEEDDDEEEEEEENMKEEDRDGDDNPLGLEAMDLSSSSSSSSGSFETDSSSSSDEKRMLAEVKRMEQEFKKRQEEKKKKKQERRENRRKKMKQKEEEEEQEDRIDSSLLDLIEEEKKKEDKKKKEKEKKPLEVPSTVIVKNLEKQYMSRGRGSAPPKPDNSGMQEFMDNHKFGKLQAEVSPKKIPKEKTKEEIYLEMKFARIKQKEEEFTELKVQVVEQEYKCRQMEQTIADNRITLAKMLADLRKMKTILDTKEYNLQQMKK